MPNMIFVVFLIMDVFPCNNGAQTTCGMCFIYTVCIFYDLTSLFHIMFLGWVCVDIFGLLLLLIILLLYTSLG